MTIDLGDIQANLTELEKRLDKTEDAVSKCLKENSQKILQLNKDQLLFGRNADGGIITPTYLSDPYFSTPEKAKKYAEHKKKLESSHNALIVNKSLYPPKGSDTPNLRVTGKMHDSMYVNISGQYVESGASWHRASDINAKYHNNLFGYSEDSILFFWEETLMSFLNNFYSDGLQLY